MEPVPFQELSPDALEEVLRWRNHPEVRRWMHSGDPIPPETHLAFARKLADDPANRYWKVGNLGVIYLNRIDRAAKSGEIGLYANPEEAGTGRGTRLLAILLEIAFEELGLERLRLEVLEENRRAVALYRKTGFRQISAERGLLTMELGREITRKEDPS